MTSKDKQEIIRTNASVQYNTALSGCYFSTRKLIWSQNRNFNQLL